nr:hypothetical protein [Tanacetum cinerariifolium]
NVYNLKQTRTILKIHSQFIEDVNDPKTRGVIQALKERKKTNRRQPGTGGSIKGTGRIPRVPDESTVVFATSSEGIDEIYKYKIQVPKDVDVEMKEAKTVERENKEKDEMTDAAKANVENTAEEKGDTELARNVMTSDYQIQSPSVLKVLVSVISETIVLPPILKNPTKTLVSTTLSPPQVTPTISIMQQTTTSILTPPITIDAPTITTAIPESDALIAVQVRFAKFKKDVSEMKNIDHSTKALASLKSQIPTIIEYYLGSKIESKKSASEIHKINREQAEKKKMPKYTIKSTDKAKLKEYDQKSTLYQNNSFNRILANHALYHALMESLIEDENDMDKRVANTAKHHKIHHDDDEDPSDEPNQGSKTGKSASAKEPTEELIAEAAMDDAVNTAGEDVVHDDDQPQDTLKPKT